MSARVYNPILVSDLRNLRKATSSEVRKPPSVYALSKIRRNLFGPVDHESSRKFVDNELTKIQAQASEKWGFDFVAETPLPGRNRYAWERVNEKTKVPEAYSFRISSPLAEPTMTVQSVPVQEALLQILEEPSCDLSEPTERVQKGEVTPPSQIQKLDDLICSGKLSVNSRQPKITHYMRHCKRPITAKKLDGTLAKKRRLAPSSTSS